MAKIYDTIIVGSGPGGLTSALYASRSNLDVLLLGGVNGGQLLDTDLVENYTGVGEITGPELAEKMYNDATKFGVETKIDLVQEVDLIGEVKEVKTMMGETYYAKTIIVASGTQYRDLDVPGGMEFRGMGISNCFTCDAPFFRNQQVVVIGGGDSAVEGAEYLTNFTDKVTLIHRRDELRAEPINQTRLKNNDSIEILWNNVPDEIIGNEFGVTLLRAIDVNSGEITDIDTSGIFVAIGSVPNTSFLKGSGLDTDVSGYITVNSRMETNVSGVYAIGDVTSNPLKQIATAVGDGSIAGQEVYNYLNKA